MLLSKKLQCYLKKCSDGRDKLIIPTSKTVVNNKDGGTRIFFGSTDYHECFKNV